MLLCVDIGNSNIVCGLFAGEELKFTARISTHPARTADEYSVIIEEIFTRNGYNLKTVEGSILSSVVPNLTQSVARALKSVTKKDPVVMGVNTVTGYNIGINATALMGSDLICNIAGTLAKYNMPAAVIDMGTATTMTLLDKNAQYKTVTIAPGVGISLGALSERAAQLPYIDLDGPTQLFTTNTVECMRSGVLYGYSAMIDGMVKNFEDALGEKVNVILTGGVSGKIAKYCRCNPVCNPNLLLEGMRILYYRNVENPL